MAKRFAFATAPVASKPVRKRKVRKHIAIDGLADLSACRRLRAAILAIEAEIEYGVKEQTMDTFVTAGRVKRGRPDNFVGQDGQIEASCQLRQRSLYGASDETLTAIKQMAKDTGTGDLVTETEVYQFDPDVLRNVATRKAIEKALASVPDLPANVIVKRKIHELDPDAIGKLFVAKWMAEPHEIEASLQLISTLAIRCDYDSMLTASDVQRVACLLPALNKDVS